MSARHQLTISGLSRPHALITAKSAQNSCQRMRERILGACNRVLPVDAAALAHRAEEGAGQLIHHVLQAVVTRHIYTSPRQRCAP